MNLFGKSIDPVHKASLNDLFTIQTDLILEINSYS